MRIVRERISQQISLTPEAREKIAAMCPQLQQVEPELAAEVKKMIGEL